MKKILFLIALFTLFVGANSYAAKLYADLSKLTTVDEVNATWADNTITWIGQSNNMVSNFDFDAGDYSSWEKIVVNITSLNNAIGVRVQIRAGGVEKTKAFNGTGEIEVNLKDFGFEGDALTSVEWIRMLGSGWYDGESHTINAENPASAIIGEVYLYKSNPNLGTGTKTPRLLLRNGAINSSEFGITPIAPSTLTTDNLYAATFTSKGGYCNTFKYEGLDVSDYDKAVVNYTIERGNGDWHINLPNGSHTALPIGTDQVYVVDLKDVDTYGDFTVFNWNHSGKSITISEVYLFKSSSVEFEFDAFGKGTVDKSKLTAIGGLTYDPSTGVLSSDGTAGSLALEFATPVDMRNLFQFNVANSGQTGDILSRLEFYDEDDTKINTWNGIKLGNTSYPGGIDDNATNAFLNHKPVKRMVWPSDANASNKGKTATITSVAFTCKTIACKKAGETQLNTLPYKTMAGASTTPAWNMNVSNSLYYGSTTGDAAVSYADVTDYEEIRIYRDDNTGFRAFFINSAGTNVNNINDKSDASSWNIEGKYWSIDLSKVEKYGEIVALQGIKSTASWISDAVKDIEVYKTPAVGAAKYTLTGSGMQLAETVAALADASATCIDATGVTGITTNTAAGRTLLTSANPNCLFLGTTGNGALANTHNVVTSGTCDNLELTDGYPFKAPAEFTATTSVSYDRTLTEGKTTTVCLPFALSAEEAATMGKFYALTNLADETLTFTRDEDEISANTPYLFVPATTAFDDYASKTIAATPASIKTSVTGVEFIGTLASTTIPASDGSTDYYAFNNGDLVKIETKEATLPAFRGYFKVTSGGGARLATLFIEDSLTGINEVSNSEDIKAVNNFEGKVFENGKIVIFKKGMKFNAAGAQIK